jgi:hypothetical protein
MLVSRFLLMADSANVGPRAPDPGVDPQLRAVLRWSFTLSRISLPTTRALTSKKILARLNRAAPSLARIFLLPLVFLSLFRRSP